MLRFSERCISASGGSRFCRNRNLILRGAVPAFLGFFLYYWHATPRLGHRPAYVAAVLISDGCLGLVRIIVSL